MGVCTKRNAEVKHPLPHTTKTRQTQIKSGVFDGRNEHYTKQKTGTVKEQRNTGQTATAGDASLLPQKTKSKNGNK